jgi:hypothetical protein
MRSDTSEPLFGEVACSISGEETDWLTVQPVKVVGRGDWGMHAPQLRARGLRLRTASGAEMGHYGKQDLMFQYEGNDMLSKVRFQAADVGKPLMSVGRVVEGGRESDIINCEKGI